MLPKGESRTRKAVKAMREVGRDNRLQVMLTDNELSAINDYQFDTRLTSRAEAVRELIRLGLETHRHRAAGTST